MTIQVKNCRNCPFSEATIDTDGETILYAECYAPVQVHDKYKIDSYYRDFKTPKWCPLYKGNLSIEHVNINK